MQSLPESLKSFANRIARTAVTNDATQMVRLLRMTGLMGDASGSTSAGPSGVTVADLDQSFGETALRSYGANVGIWEPRMVNGKVSFVRRMDAMHEWNYWADVGRIEPKSDKTRVLLIGESVARGYLYDPVFNPAMALQQILESQFGEGGVEVIDLARTNLGFQILEVALNALQMEPDIAVVFAGNNWYILEPSPSGVAEIDRAIATEGLVGAKRVIDAQLAQTSRRMVRQICTAYASKGVPLIWIIPEFNLRDWQDPITNAPYLGVGQNKRWLELLAEAQSALREREFEQAASLAQQMIEIDRGLCVAGLYILAECSRRAHDVEAERKYLTAARDSSSWDLSQETIPRPYSVMQEAVRAETSKHGIQVIDLPTLFKEHLRGGIPDRRLFVDYCHLTTEGIRVAMGATAAGVLHALKGVDRSGYALVSERVAPSPETEAEASFLAAITNAHCGQSYDVVQYFFQRALAYSKHVGPFMLDYMELQTQRSVPPRMSETEEQMWKAESPLMRNLLRLNRKRLDKMLLKVTINALEEAGFAARERLESICFEEHSVTHDTTDLLEYYYCSAADQPQELVWAHRCERYRPVAEYYRAYWPESRFVFVGGVGSAVRLTLTCRLPKPTPRDTTIKINLNGKPQAEFAIDSTWSTWDIELPGEAVHEGLNEVSVNWPIPEFESDKALERARLQIIERKFPEFYSVFGEIHTFTAADGRPAATRSSVTRAESSVAQVA